jgi:hypothetical protein
MQTTKETLELIAGRDIETGEIPSGHRGQGGARAIGMRGTALFRAKAGRS